MYRISTFEQYTHAYHLKKNHTKPSAVQQKATTIAEPATDCLDGNTLAPDKWHDDGDDDDDNDDDNDTYWWYGKTSSVLRKQQGTICFLLPSNRRHEDSQPGRARLDSGIVARH